MSNITAAMLPALLGRPVAYQPVFTQLPGVSVQGAIFLSQALFLCNTPTAQRRDGWFWKEQQGAHDSWEAETGMSAKQQQTARRQLVAIGVLEEVRKGVPAKTWYRVNCDRLAEQLAEALSDDKPQEQAAKPATGQNLPSGETGNSQSENQESPNGSAQNLPNGDFLQRLQQRIPPTPLSGASDAGADPLGQAANLDDNGQPLDRTPEPRQQPMTYDWQPDATQLAAACLRRQLPTGTWPDADTLADFTDHFAQKPSERRTAQGWHERLAKWLAEDRRRQYATPQATTGGPDHAQRSAAHRGDGRQSEREAVREQLANPADTSWADGWWPEDDATEGADTGAGESGVHPAGSDLPEDLGECVSECGHAESGPAGAGAGIDPLVGAADAAGGRAGDERPEASGEYLAADDPGAGLDAGADPGGLRYAGDW
ncbi:hypothetical protein IM870_17995 [Halomonas elongata]|nr:hypothetical protein [Halomonas elongata]